MADRLERLTSLIALLLSTVEPLTIEQISDRLPGLWPTDPENRRATFERDKRLLRDEGVPVETVMLPGEGGRSGYRIDPRLYSLPDLELDADERAALDLCVAIGRFETSWGEQALWKLGADVGDRAEVALAVAHLPTSNEVATLYDALRVQAPVRFRYHQEDRTVDPYQLVARGGAWYLIGRDHARGEQRTFRLDRFESTISVGDPGSYERPEPIDARGRLPDDAMQMGGGAPVDVEVLVDHGHAAKARVELGTSAQFIERDDGVLARFSVRNRDFFRSWLFSFGEHAVVLGPPDVRASVVEWLDAVLAGSVGGT